MTATADVHNALFELVEEERRVYAVDRDGAEICGARLPLGHHNWLVYTTTRVTNNIHQVIATTRDTAVEHVRMIAELYTREVSR